MATLHTYLPQDRLHALSRGETLPDRTSGAALFADISGFTALTEALHDSLGSRHGAEELTKHLDAVYTALIAEVEKYGGSVLGFAGDAITCWFDGRKDGGRKTEDGDAARRAVTCAFALQTAMEVFKAIALPNGKTTSLTLKVSVATGNARRFVVGDPDIHYIDALAGATVARTSAAEHLTNKGEALVDEATVNALGAMLSVKEWRASESGEKFAVAGQLSAHPNPQSLIPNYLTVQPLDPEKLKAWIDKIVYERESAGQESFLTEFRPCAVLFVNFTGIDYDSDEAAKQLDTFIRQLQTIAERYAGVVLQLIIGDKGSYVYISFGALSAHEDDTRRAVKAALELKNKSDLQLQMGLTHGVMRVGAYGGATRRTYGALGDEVNLAARLMQSAAQGEILLSGTVQKMVANHFDFEPRPPLPMKGKAEPLPVFAVTGERNQRAIRLQEPTYALPMVGREKELGIINDKLGLAEKGQGQVIGIVAEAGMGKSRLVAEVIRAAHKKGFVGYGGSCQSDAVNTPYQAWKSIWQAFFDVDPSASLKKQMRLLEGEIKDRVPERVQAMPLLGILLNLEIPDNDFTKTLEPKYKQSALRALLEDCLRAAADVRTLHGTPLLIVIEDLHWVDALSHDLIEELARALSDSRVCFVLAYRPPQIARLEAPRIEALTNFTKIELHELTQAEAEQAIHAKLAQLYPARGGAVPAVLAQKLMERAQGNPFYLEELLNFLHDRGLDPRDPTALEKIELPDSLYTLILSRIDQLSEREKTTLHVASIIGRLFRAAWLTGCYPELGEQSLVKVDLEQLAEMDITPLDSSEPELTYLFKHIVTHEVTYESLPFATRSKLHEQLARYLETLGASVDTIAHHYGRSDNTTKKREYYQKAADVAQAVSAFNTVVEYLARLMQMTPPTDPSRSALALQLADAHYYLSDFPATRTAIAQAQAAAMNDTDRAAALVLLGNMTNTMGDYAEAQTILSEAVSLVRASGDGLILCRALSALGVNYNRLGKLDNAKIVLEESLMLARGLGNLIRELSVLNSLGVGAGQQGDWNEAERFFTEVHKRATATGNRQQVMMALNNLSWVAGERQDERKDYAASRKYSQQALALAREIGAQSSIALSLINLADGDIQLGQLAEAQAGLREGLALALRLGTLPWVVMVVIGFAEFAHAEGQTERALALLGLARLHPVWSSENQRELDATLAEWALDPSVVEAGLKAGESLDWDATVRELLK